MADSALPRRTFAAFLGAILLVAATTVVVAGVTLRHGEQLRGETRERQNQTCLLFERQQLAAAQRVRGTYRFLDELPPSEYGTPLVVAIIRGLPDTEREARISKAPAFCDRPNIGLPEPTWATCHESPPIMRNGPRPPRLLAPPAAHGASMNDRRHHRHAVQRLYAREQILLVMVAAFAVSVGGLLIAHPSLLRRTQLSLAVWHPVDEAWALLFFTGGVLTLAGIWRLDARLEAAGAALLAACFAVNMFAVIHVRGFAETVVGVGLYVALTTGCAAHAVMTVADSRRHHE